MRGGAGAGLWMAVGGTGRGYRKKVVGTGSFGLLGRGLAEADFLGCFHVRLGNQKSHLLASMSDQIHCPEMKESGEAGRGAVALPLAVPPSPGTGLAPGRRGAYLM